MSIYVGLSCYYFIIGSSNVWIGFRRKQSEKLWQYGDGSTDNHVNQ